MLVPQHSHGGAVVKPQSSRFGGFIHSDSFLYANLRSTQNFGEQIKAMGADLDALGDLRKDLLEIRTGLEADVSGVACCSLCFASYIRHVPLIDLYLSSTRLSGITVHWLNRV